VHVRICGTESLTISIDRLGICRTGCPCVDIGRKDEDRILEGSSRNRDFFDIFQCRPRRVTFATGRTDDTFIFQTRFSRDCDSGTLDTSGASKDYHNKNRGGAYDQTGEGLQITVGLLRTSAVLLVQRRERASVFGLLWWRWPIR